MTVPTGVNSISADVCVLQRTIAFGKGWGDFDFRATISQQYPFRSINPAVNTVSSFGAPILANLALQYHLFQYLWPEVEVNYEFWPNGVHKDLTQGHDHTRRTVATLQSVMARQRILDRMKTAVRRGDAFNRLNAAAVGLYREHKAGPDRHAIDEDRACAADAVFAADMGSSQPELLPQEIGEADALIDTAVIACAVDNDGCRALAHS